MENDDLLLGGNVRNVEITGPVGCYSQWVGEDTLAELAHDLARWVEFHDNTGIGVHRVNVSGSVNQHI